MRGFEARGLTGIVVQALAGRISSGQLRAYEPFDLAALEVELKVSRTSVREALKVLAAKGMVESRQRRGTYALPRERWALLDADVVRWDFADGDTKTTLRDLHEVRSVIEPEIASLAAVRRTDEDVAALDAALSAMASAIDPSSAAAADKDFHVTLAAAAQNDMFLRIQKLLAVVLAERVVAVTPGGVNPVPSHQRVVAAVAASKPEEASVAMRSLLQLAGQDDLRLTGGC